ncbi:hypothetical protein FE257_008316 [Aspergillus nanangensis]|uniref:Uncharacterized protein n=1 Tax=Aspergillus nanangensis TaxID=2582783 RepID=A0AAD4CLM2_ASPNN|nr:hypothetical protein FE257_008316 [Aspergillus nanangensis]
MAGPVCIYTYQDLTWTSVWCSVSVPYGISDDQERYAIAVRNLRADCTMYWNYIPVPEWDPCRVTVRVEVLYHVLSPYNACRILMVHELERRLQNGPYYEA